MDDLVEALVVAPHLLSQKPITKTLLNIVPPEFWEFLESIAQQHGKQLRAGHRMIIAQALRKWILENIPQD